VRHEDVELVEVGLPGVAGRLLEHLKQPGNLVIIAVDAPWPADRPGSFERPFAGHENQSFATGASRLARLAQCPIVTCVSYLEDDGRIVLEWDEPVPPPPAADRSADVRVTSGLLDTIERAVGRRPTQYVLKIGDDRQWDPTTEQWKPVRSAEVETGAIQAAVETQS
jgi:lauroyl/myristoyl acyltransferase